MDQLKKSLMEIALGSLVTLGGITSGITYSNIELLTKEPKFSDSVKNTANSNLSYLIGISGLILTAYGIKDLSKSEN